MKRVCCLLVLALGFLMYGGCAAFQPRVPTQQEIDSEDIWPIPDNYIEMVREAASRGLKDPYSAQFRFVGEPTKSFIFENGEAYICWIGTVWINAKNSFGAYTGEKPYMYAIRYDSIFALRRI